MLNLLVWAIWHAPAVVVQSQVAGPGRTAAEEADHMRLAGLPVRPV